MPFDLLNETTQDAAVAKIATGASFSGGLTAFWGGASLNEVAMYVGLLVAVLGFIVQLVVQGHLWLCRLKTQRRELRFRFESNTLGGNYQMGLVLAHVQPGDGTTLG